jgi:hypothetical protein
MIESAEEFVCLRTSDDPSEYLRAANESATDGVWIDIITRFPEMKEWVVQNKTVPIDVIALLARDENPDIRYAVAKKNSLSVDLLKELAKDEDGSVRLAVAVNKRTPIDLLQILVLDEWQTVAETAREQIQARSKY